ncbi:MAG: xanthine dehydrogenase molybdopterin binding subunit, partial [Alphaproteobacteria bacterium]
MNAPLAQGAALAHDSALGHVTGRAPFADDVPEAPGMLHGALLLSPVAHGRLGTLDIAAARAMLGVVAVLTAQEVPGANDISPSGREVEPLFADGELRHHGQPIALVVGATRDAALAALSALKPEIEALPAILSIEDAL